MPRKLLFVVFTDEPCRLNHAFLYAIDLKKRGHEIQMVMEGPSTKHLTKLKEADSRFTQLFREAKSLGLIHGVCAQASSGCASDDPKRNMTDIVTKERVPLLSDLHGHAGIASLVGQGYEVVVF